MKSTLDQSVDRFLGWKLPADFCPDNGISFKLYSDYEHPAFGRTKYEPIGTNLFTADQAKAMLEHVCEPLLAALKERDAEIAKAKAMPMKYRRMEFNAQLQEENEKLRAELAALKQQEPRAWINYKVITDKNGNFAGVESGKVGFTRLSYGYDWDKSEPLYRAADHIADAGKMVQAQEQRKPLALEQIKSMDYRGSLDEHIRAVRMTEAAHGIKEQP